jgi:hypothetical protein
MRNLAILAVLLVVVPTNAPAKSGRNDLFATPCDTACGKVTADCTALGGGRAHCRRYWMRQCRRSGVGACLVSSNTTSTTVRASTTTTVAMTTVTTSSTTTTTAAQETTCTTLPRPLSAVEPPVFPDLTGPWVLTLNGSNFPCALTTSPVSWPLSLVSRGGAGSYFTAQVGPLTGIDWHTVLAWGVAPGKLGSFSADTLMLTGSTRWVSVENEYDQAIGLRAIIDLDGGVSCDPDTLCCTTFGLVLLGPVFPGATADDPPPNSLVPAPDSWTVEVQIAQQCGGGGACRNLYCDKYGERIWCGPTGCDDRCRGGGCFEDPPLPSPYGRWTLWCGEGGCSDWGGCPISGSLTRATTTSPPS